MASLAAYKGWTSKLADTSYESLGSLRVLHYSTRIYFYCHRPQISCKRTSGPNFKHKLKLKLKPKHKLKLKLKHRHRHEHERMLKHRHKHEPRLKHSNELER